MSVLGVLGDALGYAARGWPVFPVDGKRPLARAAPHGLHDASVDPDVIRGWWGRFPRAGVAVVMGPASGLWCLDVDGAEGQDSVRRLRAEHGGLGSPVWSRTGAGWHALFRYPAGAELGNTARRLPGLDSRGRGGYCVVAPSRHENGSTYSWWPPGHAPGVPGPPPGWLLEALAPPANRQHVADLPRPLPTGGGRAEAWVRRALEGEVERVAAAPEGERNRRLNLASYSLGQLVGAGLLDEDVVVDQLAHAAAAAGLPEREAAATIKSGMTAGARRPRQVAL